MPPLPRLPSHPPLRLSGEWCARHQARSLPPAAGGPRAGAACPCRRLPRALPAAHRPFTRPLSVLRRPHDRNRGHPPCQHFRRGGSLEHLMIPMRDPNRAQCPEPAPAVDAATPPSLPATGDRRYPGNQPSKPRRPPNPLISLPPMAATSIPIAAHGHVAAVAVEPGLGRDLRLHHLVFGH